MVNVCQLYFIAGGELRLGMVDNDDTQHLRGWLKLWSLQFQPRHSQRSQQGTYIAITGAIFITIEGT